MPFVSLKTVSKIPSSNPRQYIFSFNGNFNGNSPVIKTEPLSTYTHANVYSLGSYKGDAFVTGSWISHRAEENNLKTEILNYTANEWTTAADYPFTTNRLIQK